jgi:hypothetical protein
MNEALNPGEQKALESLISAVLHQFSNCESVSDEEIDNLLKEGYSLSDEQRNALQKLGGDPFEWMTKKSGAPREGPAVREQAPELAGMYRQGSDESLDSETKKLIEEKRNQIIRRLREKGKNVE